MGQAKPLDLAGPDSSTSDALCPFIPILKPLRRPCRGFPDGCYLRIYVGRVLAERYVMDRLHSLPVHDGLAVGVINGPATAERWEKGQREPRSLPILDLEGRFPSCFGVVQAHLSAEPVRSITPD